jgi:hypothetical protein
MTTNTTMIETTAPQGSGTSKRRPSGSVSPKLQQRMEREARARRGLFVASVAGLVATLGIVAVSAGAPQATNTVQSVAASESQGQRFVAEVPIQLSESQNVATIVRIVAPAPDAPTRDVSTRATP